MHDDTTAAADDYRWPTCTNCQKPLWEDELDRQACRPCQNRAAQHLATIGELYPILNTTTALTPGSRTTNSNGAAPAKIHAPLPLRVDVLDLTAPGGIGTRLQAIEDAWRLAFGRRIHVQTFAGGRINQATDVPGHLTFLAINLERACESYDSISHDMKELAALAGACKAALANGPRPACVQIGTCPTRLDDQTICGTPLTAKTDRHTITCTSCGTRWDTPGAWRDLRAAQRAADRTAA